MSKDIDDVQCYLIYELEIMLGFMQIMLLLYGECVYPCFFLLLIVVKKKKEKKNYL